ncbi:hypothetical protein QCA50_011337 [Cerrena zonata]|uniref:Uncharacterized protein n=1 Tax=Cerrena zonata TaxID=2478898 RepID=A0AAW0G683_9APHY
MRSPILGHQSIRSDSDAEPSAHLPCTELIGPIALLRLLTRLAERGLIMQSQSWTQLPEGTSSSTTVQDIKQILEPTVLKKILAIAVKRISRFREYIRDRVQKGLYHTALINYIPLAELALSVLEFDRVTGGTFANATCGARKELVLCLGNAAEMAIRKGLNDDALRLAAAANFYGAGAPREEKIPVEVVEKNKRRLAEAKRVLNID